MNIESILVGASSFLIIGIFHPVVIKAEYYFSCNIWPLFLAAGLGLLAGALFTEGTLSLILSLTGFCCLWSIIELFHQKKRVEKGWFPKNPKRKD
jgi:uncharacterized membrane protein HdeD (DUF308 family)